LLWAGKLIHLFTFQVENMATSPEALFPGADIKRPAIIETSFANEANCTTAKNFYAGLLGSVPPSATPPYLFVVPVDVSLILVVSDDGLARTTIYWELANNTSANLANVYKELKDKHKCRHVKPPHKPPYNSLVGVKGTMEVCTLLDPSGSLFGLVINPPVPTI
jgi:hypothetical protein